MSFTRLQAVVDQHLEGRDALRILEAGCGSASHLRFGPGAHLVGIDISERQLDRNGALDEKIVGDLQSHPLGSGYDLIVCWDVLEHLPRPDDALENMLASVAPGGLLVIAAVVGLYWMTHRMPVWKHNSKMPGIVRRGI